MKRWDKSQILYWALLLAPPAFAVGALAFLPRQVMVFWQGYPGRLAPRWEVLVAPAMLAVTTLIFWGVLDWMAHSAELSPFWRRMVRGARLIFTIIFTAVGVISTINAMLL